MIRNAMTIAATIQLRRHRRTSFLDTSLRLDGITVILNAVCEEPVTYSRLLMLSHIKFKKSFIKYLKYCKDQGFVLATPGINRTKGRGENHHVVYHIITAKGRNFLELVS